MAMKLFPYSREVHPLLLGHKINKQAQADICFKSSQFSNSWKLRTKANISQVQKRVMLWKWRNACFNSAKFAENILGNRERKIQRSFRRRRDASLAGQVMNTGKHKASEHSHLSSVTDPGHNPMDRQERHSCGKEERLSFSSCQSTGSGNISSEEENYEDEGKDKVPAQIVNIARSKSLNFSMSGRRRAVRDILTAGQSISIDESKLASNNHQTEDDLPVLAIENPPPGWGASPRRRTLATPTNTDIKQRRSSMLPTGNGNAFPAGRRTTRRASQITFDEWVQVKKLQEIHAAAISEQNKKSSSTPKFQKNITYEEWCNSVQDRKQKELEMQEAEKRKVEEEKLAQESAKFKRRLSFDKWLKAKEAAKKAADKAKKQKQKDGKTKKDDVSSHQQILRRPSIDDIDFEALNGSPEERKKQSEEVYRKWLIKKELEEIKKARDMLLRMQHPGFAISPPGENHPSPVGRRRGSFVDANPELHVAANRNKRTNSTA